MTKEVNVTELQDALNPSVIYLVTNEDKMTVESAHWKLEDAKKEVDGWAKHEPQSTFMVVEIEIH